MNKEVGAMTPRLEAKFLEFRCNNTWWLHHCEVESMVISNSMLKGRISRG